MKRLYTREAYKKKEQFPGANEIRSVAA